MVICAATSFVFFLTNTTHAQQATIVDGRHYSYAFGEQRNYRIFLPPAYNDSPAKRYPVIYFFHGWGQRYFGEGADQYAAFDKGDDNKGDNIANFVAKHDVIVVKWDGYNKRNDEPFYRRPYNVSPVESYRQFPIYFPELVDHIDKSYKTLSQRTNRGIAGLSMGGFMSYFVAAKYPHLVSAAGSFCGSPEFEIGPFNFSSEYRHLDMYRNFGGINVRLHYGDKDFIRSYHEDMNRVLPQLMNNYSYKVFDAEHSTAGLGEMLDTIMSTFKKPIPVPSRWHHTDVYPNFSVWDYEISSDRNQTGFTVLENVDANGFSISVRRHVPDGEVLSSVKVSVTTAPVYDKNSEYLVNDFDLKKKLSKQYAVTSDEKGRLTINLDGAQHDVGINKKAGNAIISLAAFEAVDAGWVTRNKETTLNIKLLNKGFATAKNVDITLSALRNNVDFPLRKISYGNIPVNAVQDPQQKIIFRTTDTAEVIQLKIDIAESGKIKWTEYIDVPIKKEVQEIKDFEIADGRTVLVTSGGTSMKPMLLGKGNGDGIANPGESIVVLVKDSNKLWKTELKISDKYVNPNGVNVRESDNWTTADNVGASAKYSVPLIAGDCSSDHNIKLFAEYWVPQSRRHIIKQGTITINVKGKDATAPDIKAVMIHGNNVIEARIHDGSAVKSATATLFNIYDAANTVRLELNDTGTNGDVYAGDNVFSVLIPSQRFGEFRLIVEATDSLGNTGSSESGMVHIVH